VGEISKYSLNPSNLFKRRELSNEMSNGIYYNFADKLLKLSHIHKYFSKVIGYKKSKKMGLSYPLYKFTINPNSKAKFCIVAGVHGDEIAGPWSILELMKRPKFFKKEICYQIFPLLNPTGFELRKRFNDKRCDPNCLNKKTLKSKNYKEIQSFYQEVKDEEFEIFISMHEDLDQDKVYQYIYERDFEPIYRKLFKNERKWKTGKIYGDKSDGMGLIKNIHDHSLEDRLFSMGKSKISLATETPGELSLDKRISMNLNNLKILNDYLLLSITLEQ